MAGMCGRFSTVVKAKINKLLDKAEDPGETLDYSYQAQLQNLQNVKKGIADVVTAKKRLQIQADEARAGASSSSTRRRVRRSARARRTSPHGARAQDGRADRAADARPADRRARPAAAELTSPSSGCARRSRPFRTKKEVIKAQYSAAEASVRISEAATGVGEEMADVGLAMQRAVDKTENMRARAGADRGARGRRHVRRHHAARLRRGRHRPAAPRADVAESGRRRAREDEGGARPGGAPPRRPRSSEGKAGQA